MRTCSDAEQVQQEAGGGDRLKTKCRLFRMLRRAAAVAMVSVKPYMLWTSYSSTPPWWLRLGGSVEVRRSNCLSALLILQYPRPPRPLESVLGSQVRGAD